MEFIRYTGVLASIFISFIARAIYGGELLWKSLSLTLAALLEVDTSKLPIRPLKKTLSLKNSIIKNIKIDTITNNNRYKKPDMLLKSLKDKQPTYLGGKLFPVFLQEM